MMQGDAPACGTDNDRTSDTVYVEGFTELLSSAQAGRAADVVSELLFCRRDGGPRILNAAIDRLDSLELDGPAVTVTITGEVVRALAARDVRTATHAFELASACAKRGDDRRAALIGSGAIKYILSTMVRFKEDHSLQYLGMQIMSDIIWTNVDGLRDFVRADGFQHVEDVMQRFPQDAKLQRRAIAQITSAAKWPDELEMKREFDFQPFRAIALTKQAMLLHPGDADLQLKGMEAMTSLVGTSHDDLYAWASGAGLHVYESAMLRFPENAAIQEKVFKTFSGAIHWPEDVCQRVGYCPERGLAFMKQAMSLQVENEKLQRVATERLEKDFLPKFAEAIARCGGGDLLRAVMMQHQHAEDVRSCCRRILRAIGEPVPNLSYRADVLAASSSPKSEMLELSQKVSV